METGEYQTIGAENFVSKLILQRFEGDKEFRSSLLLKAKIRPTDLRQALEKAIPITSELFNLIRDQAKEGYTKYNLPEEEAARLFQEPLNRKISKAILRKIFSFTISKKEYEWEENNPFLNRPTINRIAIAPSFQAYNESMYETRMGADFTFARDGVKHKMHRYILMRSPILRQILLETPIQLTKLQDLFKNLSTEEIDHLLKYLYTDLFSKDNFQNDSIVRLYEVGKKLELDAYCEQLMKLIDSRLEELDMISLIKIASLADDCAIQPLQELLRWYVATHPNYLNGVDFLSFNLGHLLGIYDHGKFLDKKICVACIQAIGSNLKIGKDLNTLFNYLVVNLKKVSENNNNSQIYSDRDFKEEIVKAIKDNKELHQEIMRKGSTYRELFMEIASL